MHGVCARVCVCVCVCMYVCMYICIYIRYSYLRSCHEGICVCVCVCVCVYIYIYIYIYGGTCEAPVVLDGVSGELHVVAALTPTHNTGIH
jgi:hypothetical protein